MSIAVCHFVSVKVARTVNSGSTVFQKMLAFMCSVFPSYQEGIFSNSIYKGMQLIIKRIIKFILLLWVDGIWELLNRQSSRTRPDGAWGGNCGTHGSNARGPRLQRQSHSMCQPGTVRKTARGRQGTKTAGPSTLSAKLIWTPVVCLGDCLRSSLDITASDCMYYLF